MKLIAQFFTISISCSAFHVNAEQLSQEKYNALLGEQREIIENTKAILEDENTQAKPTEQYKALCDRINAYTIIKKISQENISLEDASAMFLAANFYLERQQKSLQGNGAVSAVFCKTK